MSKLRVLVLVREGHVPPASLDGIADEELDAWKAEFDVCETLRRLGHEVFPLGVYDDLSPIRNALRDFAQVSTAGQVDLASQPRLRQQVHVRIDETGQHDAAAAVDDRELFAKVARVAREDVRNASALVELQRAETLPAQRRRCVAGNVM